MAKTKYQEAAAEYAKDYLERLLRMEDMVGHNMTRRTRRLAEEKKGKEEKETIKPIE